MIKDHRVTKHIEMREEIRELCTIKYDNSIGRFAIELGIFVHI